MPDHVVNIGEVIVCGIVFDPKNEERLRTMDFDNLLQSIPRLFELLEEREVPYVLVGGIAMLVYVEGRNTQDIDLVIAKKDLEKLPEIEIDETNADFARGRYGDLPVDFLFTRNKLFKRVQSQFSEVKQFVERRIVCATVEGIVLLKLFALPSLYRQGRFGKADLYQSDVQQLMREFNPEVKPLIAELSQHMLPSDIAELEDIVAKIQTDIVESRRRFGRSQ